MIQPCQALDQRFAVDSAIAMEMRSHDWSQTSLGSIEAWPSTLKTTLNILWHTPCPMFLVWGGDRHLFYNDACSFLMGKGNCPPFGQPMGANKMWSMAYLIAEQVFSSGQSVQNQQLSIAQDGPETLCQWLYSPLWDSDGQISGVFATGTLLPALTPESQRVGAEHRWNETALRESKDFQSMFTMTSVGMAQADIKTRRFLRVNAAFCAITGYTEAELLTLKIDDINHPEERDRDRDRDCVNQLLRRETSTYQAEKRYLCKDGSFVWVLVTGNVIFDLAGQPLRMVAVIQDITERKQTEDDLRKSEERFRRVTQAVDGLIFDWNLQTDEVYRSEKLYDLIGVEVKDVPSGASWWHERIHPDDRLRLTPFIHELLADPSQEIYESEYRVRHEDGHWVDVWEQACLVRNEQGQLIRIVGGTVDVSNRKQAENERTQAEFALREGERRLQMALEGAGGGLWDWDIATNEAYMSPRWLEMLGYQEGDLPPDGYTWEQMIHPDDKAWVMERTRAYLEDDTVPYKFEYRLRSKTGQWQWIATYGKVVIRDAQGHPLRMAGIHHDVSDRKRIEEALKNSEERLRFAIEGADLGTWEYDLATRKVIWSIYMIGVVLDITDRKQTELEREHLLLREQQYVRQLQGLTDAALAINSALSMEEVLQVITDQAASMIGAHQSVISMTLNQNWAQSISAVYLSDKYAPWRNYSTKPDGSGIYACVCHMNCSMRVSQAELEAHPRWKGFGAESANHPPMRGWLAAPLMGRDGENIGLIQISDKREGEFTEADEAILAQLASVAIENAQLYDAEKQARALAEVAREEAQSANRLKDEFLAVLSHELRSPLNPILGWSGYQLIEQIRQRSPEHGGLISAIALTAYAGARDQQLAQNAGFQRHLAKPAEPTELIRAIAELANARQEPK